MTSAWRKCMIILHKQFHLRVYHFLLTIVEILFPILLTLFVVWLKTYENPMICDKLSKVKTLPTKDIIIPPIPALYSVYEDMNEVVNIVFRPKNTYTTSLIAYFEEKLVDAKFNATFYDVNNESLHDADDPITPHLILEFQNEFNKNRTPANLEYSITVHPSQARWLGTVGVTIQHLIAMQFIERIRGHDIQLNVTFLMQRFPMPLPSFDGGLLYFGHQFILWILPLGFLFMVYPFLTQIVAEKKTGIKELLRLMGMPVKIQWFGFIVNTFVVMFFCAIIVVILLTVRIYNDTGPLFEKTRWYHLLIIFFLYILSCITFYLFFSTLCSNGLIITMPHFLKLSIVREFASVGLVSFSCLAVRATCAGIFIWITTCLIPLLLPVLAGVSYLNAFEQTAFCLFPNLALFWSLRFVALQERQDGVQWSHYYSSPTLTEDTCLLYFLSMFLLDIVLYFLLALYFDQLFPGPYGISKPFWFICAMSKCKCGGEESELTLTNPPPTPEEVEKRSAFRRFIQLLLEPRVLMKRITNAVLRSPASPYQASNFEKEPTNVPKAVVVTNLTKEFKVPRIVAVNSINFNIYKHEVFVLLGTSGCGKTVTVSMLVGWYTPTVGTVTIYEHSLPMEINQLRGKIGYCPASPMFFDDLTVKQHLRFFGMLKGLAGDSLWQEVKFLLRKLRLWDNRKKRAKNLPLAMQRRLQAGIALIGKIKLAVLDDPSSNLDSVSRQAFWELIYECRSKCCIMLTTTKMEDASAVADRIAIMSQGEIVGCGSPVFIRNHFGADFVLKITKGVGCESKQVLNFVRKHIMETYVDTNTAIDLIIVLPSYLKRLFPGLFQDIERNMDELRIISFGLSTMDFRDIFSKVSEAEPKSASKHSALSTQSASIQTMKSSDETGSRVESQLSLNRGCQHCCQQFVGQAMKRICYMRNCAMFFFIQWLIIVLVSILIFLLLSFNYSMDKKVETVVESPLWTDAFIEGKRLVVFEWHNTSRLCLPIAYAEMVPKSADLRHVNTNLTLVILKVAKSDVLGYEAKHYLMGASFTTGGPHGTVLATAMYYEGIQNDQESDYRKMVSLNLVHNAVLKDCHETGRKIVVKAQIKKTRPENATGNLQANEKKEVTEMPKANWYNYKVVLVIISVVLLSLALCLLVSCFVFLVVHERVTHFKDVQVKTTCERIIYWTTAMLMDYTFYLFCFCCSILVFCLLLFFKYDVVLEPTIPWLMFLVMLLFGWCAIPFTYIVSFFCNNPRCCYVALLAIHLFSVTVVAASHQAIEEQLPTHEYYSSRSAATFVLLLEFVPGCALSVIIFMLWIAPFRGTEYTFTEAVSEDYSGVNRIFIMLFVAGVVYWLCLVIVECCVPDNWAATYESDTSTIVDPDVEAEAERVRDLLAHHFGSHHRDDSLLSVFYNEVLLVKNLTKQFCFKPVTIDHITFEVGRNECFGILGIKGAGKTTIFQMLNGNLSPSEGNAFVFGASLRRDRKKFLSQIGYCPKKDALVDQLTAWEMVLLFARIRGIDDDNLSSVVDATLKRFGVEGYAFKQAESYSPGVRRRVSLALAFLGRPAVVLIDEPTSGLDEASKRQIWQLISSYKARGPSIIIMSPSLEECQALCSRVAVLKKGRFGYIGNCQNLKFKFGSCFKVTLKLPRTADYTQRQRTHDEAVSYMEQKFKDATIEQDEEGYFEYNLPGAPTNNWQKVFALMDAMQQKFKLEDWAAYHVTDKKGFKEFVSEDQDSTEEVS